MQQLEDKVVFITGAASGIGFGMAQAFARAGASVMLADIENTALERAVNALRSDGARVASVVCDVTQRDAVQAAAKATLETFGKAHVVCNNAGVVSGGPMEECTQGDWDWVIGVNFLGVLHGCQAFLPIIKRQQEGGHFVNTSSLAGILGGMPGWGPYNSTKFAVVGLTEVLRQEGKEGGFSASVLCPGGVNTRIADAPRNRPKRFGPQESPIVPDIETTRRGIAEQGLDARIVGELVVEAVRANRQYIFTDPRFKRQVERRHQKMMEDFDWSARSTALTSTGSPGAVKSQ